MELKMRSYQGSEDFWRIREFLRAVFQLNGMRQHSWDVVRFDYWFWHGLKNIETYRIEDRVFLWETPAGELAAMLNPETISDAFLQVHPAFRTPELEEEMIAMAEDCYGQAAREKQEPLKVWANREDVLRRAILQRRGYQPGPWPEYKRRRSMNSSLPEAPLPPGFSVRPVGDGADLLERCYASGLAFHEKDIQYAVDNRADPTWYRNIQHAPLYRRDLDLTVVDPNGAVASFCTVWFDDVNRVGVFEPVGTPPAFQKRGLGKAVMREGLKRLGEMGAVMTYVGSYSERAGALYASVGFTEYDLCEAWEKA